MLKTNHDDHRTFLLASFLWLLCYLAVCLLVVDPLQLHQTPSLHSVFTWLMLAVAGFSMGVDLLWGFKELRNHEIVARHGGGPQAALAGQPANSKPA